MSLLVPQPPKLLPSNIDPILFRWMVQVSAFLGALLNGAQTSVAGATSGSASFSQVAGGSSNRVVIYCNALDGAATWTFPSPFAHTPVVLDTTGLATSVVTALSTTAVTVTGSPSTGFLMIEGF